MQYVGIDWAYRHARWCAISEHGELVAEATTPADEDGLLRLIARLGPDVRACVEMMSGAVWVRDCLERAGWRVEVADARKLKGLAPLAAKTDRVDARLLATLAFRDLVPALSERLKRRAHLIRLRSSAKNRSFGLLSQWGLRLSLQRLREPDAAELLESRGVPEVWRRSVFEAVALVDHLDRRLAPLERELLPLARADRRVQLLDSIPGGAAILGLTLAVEIGEVSRFATARKLVGYSGLTPSVRQSGESSRTGRLSKAGSATLRWAAVEAAQHAWRQSNPWHRLYVDVKRRTGKTNAAKSAVARKVPIAAWHVLSPEQRFKPHHPVSASSPQPLAA